MCNSICEKKTLKHVSVKNSSKNKPLLFFFQNHQPKALKKNDTEIFSSSHILRNENIYERLYGESPQIAARLLKRQHFNVSKKKKRKNNFVINEL